MGGFVVWPDTRPAENVQILLEDPRWPWQTMVISANTDSKGRFTVSTFDRTVYRIHAVTMAPTDADLGKPRAWC